MLFRRFTFGSDGSFCEISNLSRNFSERIFQFYLSKSWPTSIRKSFDDFSKDRFEYFRSDKKLSEKTYGNSIKRTKLRNRDLSMDSCYIHTVFTAGRGNFTSLSSSNTELTLRKDKALMEFFRTLGKMKGEIPSHRRSFEWCPISNHWNWFFDTYTMPDKREIANEIGNLTPFQLIFSSKIISKIRYIKLVISTEAKRLLEPEIWISRFRVHFLTFHLEVYEVIISHW